MNKENISKLNKINIDFYSITAEQFNKTRLYSWNGWKLLWQFFKQNEQSVYSVLDIGCGNGRFYDFLKSKKENFKYLGIDNNEKLLKIAKKRISNLEHRISSFQKHDLLTNWSKEINQKFDLIVAFGIMHHIPAYKNRLNLIKKAGNLLKKDGLLCISIWDFYKQKRFQNKIIPWEKFHINKQNLEKNDFLLDWKKGVEAVRYCHFIDEQEIKKLVEESGLKVLHKFKADGKTNDLNKYLILAK